MRPGDLPARFGAYDVLGPLGKGGMGSLYRAIVGNDAVVRAVAFGPGAHPAHRVRRPAHDPGPDH